MVNIFSNKKNNLNILITDFNNDDFYTKFLLKDTHKLYTVKNNIETIYNTDSNNIMYNNIINKLINYPIHNLQLDKNNNINKVCNNTKEFKKTFFKSIEYLLDEINFSINIIIDLSCYTFLEIINECIELNKLHPTNINITLINNLDYINKYNDNINDLLTIFNDTCNDSNIDLRLSLFDYHKSIAHKVKDNTNFNFPKIDIEFLNIDYGINLELYDYYNNLYPKKILVHLSIIKLLEENMLELDIINDQNNTTIILDNLNFYKFKNTNIKIDKYFNTLLISVINKINANIY